MSIITTLLVDDNTTFLDSASRFLKTDGRIEVVGHATSGAEALNEVRRLRPDVVVMEVVMPDMNGLDAARHFKTEPGAPVVVIASMHDHPEMRAAATQANADGFVAKSSFCNDLLPLVKHLFDNREECPSPT